MNDSILAGILVYALVMVPIMYYGLEKLYWAKTPRDKRDAARLVLCAPVWLLVVLGFLVYGVIALCRTAFGKLED